MKSAIAKNTTENCPDNLKVIFTELCQIADGLYGGKRLKEMTAAMQVLFSAYQTEDELNVMMQGAKLEGKAERV